ncbi:hypothetical protein C4573_05505 [Candidatus Woesearchaeota archaeon]|nr:MAG: hypothetical protein C4573_05505 [Candidatus Woesearchaeota archaeon]
MNNEVHVRIAQTPEELTDLLTDAISGPIISIGFVIGTGGDPEKKLQEHVDGYVERYHKRIHGTTEDKPYRTKNYAVLIHDQTTDHLPRSMPASDWPFYAYAVQIFSEKITP